MDAPRAVKITPAAREWCRRLVNPKACVLVKTGPCTYYASGFRSFGTPTLPMIDRLEDAGLIEWRDGADPVFPERTGKIAYLTDAGKSAAK